MVAKSRRQSLLSFALLVALLSLLILPALAQADNNPPDGYYYTVKQGDTWSIVSRRTGLSVAELKRLNPKAIHPKGWLWVGERLWVPGKPPTVQPSKVEGYWYQVRPGDTWNTVAKATGVPVKQLWAANPGLLNRQLWLYLGQRVWIPAAPPTKPAVTATSRCHRGHICDAGDTGSHSRRRPQRRLSRFRRPVVPRRWRAIPTPSETSSIRPVRRLTICRRGWPRAARWPRARVA